MSMNTNNEPARTLTPQIFCRCCASPLVQAVDWNQQNDEQWHVCLWCPECGFEQVASLDRPQLVYLSLAMEEGFGWMLEALTELDAITATTADLDFAHRVHTDRIRPAGR